MFNVESDLRYRRNNVPSSRPGSGSCRQSEKAGVAAPICFNLLAAYCHRSLTPVLHLPPIFQHLSQDVVSPCQSFPGPVCLLSSLISIGSLLLLETLDSCTSHVLTFPPLSHTALSFIHRLLGCIQEGRREGLTYLIIANQWGSRTSKMARESNYPAVEQVLINAQSRQMLRPSTSRSLTVYWPLAISTPYPKSESERGCSKQ